MPLKHFQPGCSRKKPFHLRYLELCKNKNIHPLPEVKVKNKDFATLDFFGDRAKVDDWLSIINALFYDTSLNFIAVKLRKNYLSVFENINTMKKAIKFNSGPALLTNFLFTQLVDAIANVITYNSNVTSLLLEGLPLQDGYINNIVKGLTKNTSIKNLSFARSALSDTGCELICATVKHLPNIDALNFEQCLLSAKGALYVAELIKYQKILRYTKGWQETLRYRMIDPDTLPGLKRINLSGNAIGDEGVYGLAEVLKEDEWIKVLELQNCRLTDNSAQLLIECLSFNKTLMVINLRDNDEISVHFLDHLKMMLGTDLEGTNSDLSTSMNNSLVKPTMTQLREKIRFLEQQLEVEMFNRKKTEEINQVINAQIVELEKKAAEFEKRATAYKMPEGYSLIENHLLEKIMGTRSDDVVSLSDFMRAPASTPIPTSPQQQHIPVSKAKSEIITTKKKATPMIHSTNKDNRSESRLDTANTLTPYLETSIGDTSGRIMSPERCEANVMKVFLKKKQSRLSLEYNSFRERDNFWTNETSTLKGSMASLNSTLM